MGYFSFPQSIPIEDMGFLYGFSLFETFLVNSRGSTFLLDQHIGRLYNSMSFFNFDLNICKEDLKSLILNYILKSSLKNKILRITVSYGNKQIGLKASPIITQRDNPYGVEAADSKYYNLSISSIKRNESSTIISHKTSNYMENYMEGQKALNEGYDDSLFLNTRGEVAETTKCNIFFASGGVLYTPETGCGILPGIIRDWVIGKSADMGIKCRQGKFSINELLDADEAFVTNSVIGIIPINSIGNHIIKNKTASQLKGIFAEKYQDAFR